jgi:hypothetical protein
MIAVDSEFQFYVNGIYVGRGEDSTYAFGNVGLIIFSDDPKKSCVIEFDDFELREQP